SGYDLAAASSASGTCYHRAAVLAVDHASPSRAPVRARTAVRIQLVVRASAELQRRDPHRAAHLADHRIRVPVRARRTTAVGGCDQRPGKLMLAPAVADAIDPGDVQRALVIKLRHHGDVLLTSPVFTVLKRWAPHAQIDALVYRETAPMLERHPAIDFVHTIDRVLKRQGIT